MPANYNLKQLRHIAHVVRKQLAPLISSNAGAFDPDYGGSCAISSYVLARVYRKFGITSDFAIGKFDGDDHAFLIINNRIIDITATQFGHLPKVLITKIDDARYSIELRGRRALHDLTHEWPSDQKPATYRYLLNKIAHNCIKELNAKGVQKNIRRAA